MSCKSCNYGRKAGVENYVACGYYFREHKQDYNKTMVELNLESLETGWGYMHCPVDGDTNIFGRGILTNGVVIFNENFHCSNYSEK